MGISNLDQRLADAIHSQKLLHEARSVLREEAGEATADQLDMLRSVVDTCTRIIDINRSESSRICQLLRDSGIAVDSDDDPQAIENRLFHLVRIRVRPEYAGRAIQIAHDAGYLGGAESGSAAWEVQLRHGVQVILVKRGEASMRLQIRWRSKASGGLPAKLFSPRIADASFLPLPASLWGLAYLLRPVRLVLRRIGLVSAPSIQAPFLATPSELIDPLFALAGLNRTDVLLDFGCGDGRIAIEAAKRVGCRALGVDTNAELIELANQRARQAGVADQVEFSCEDASKARLDEVSVVFIFMPASDMAQAMKSLLERVKPGTRILAHEQEELSQAITPDKSQPLIGRSIVTVAHLWVAR